VPDESKIHYSITPIAVTIKHAIAATGNLVGKNDKNYHYM